MLNRQSLQQFALRLLVCVVVLGGLYIAVFGWPSHGRKLPNTPAAKIARLRTALDQTYVDSTTIVTFQQNDPASYAVMSSLIGKLGTDVKSLSADLKDAPGKVSSSQRQQIQGVIDQENGAVNAFKARYSFLDLVIAYDPQADLGGKDNNTVATRAAAAAKGIQTAANTNDDLISNAARTALKNAADCFSQLAAQAKGNQSQAAATKVNCIKNYPVARKAAIQDVIQGGLPASYEQYLKQHIPPLLNQLAKD